MLALALPVVLTQVGLMLMGVVDTLMVGRVSAGALAGVALGNLYFMVATIAAIGTLMVLDPLVAQAVGAGDRRGAARAVQRGLVLAGALTLLLSILLLPVRPILLLLRQPPEIVDLAAPYVLVSILGLLPFLAFVVLRQSLQALGAVRSLVVVVVLGNGLNAALNWVFVYGHLGSAPLGTVGSAWATCTSRWALALGLIVLSRATLREMLAPWDPGSLRLGPLWAMLRLGAPIGLQLLLELGAFAAIGLLMGVLGTQELAAHQIAITLASLTFMVPLGVGAAAAVRVGRAVGADDREGARAGSRAALVSGIGFMVASGLLFVAMPHTLASWSTRDRRVLALAATLIPIAGVFQVFDGIQAVCAGVLRGLGDTRAPFVINLAGFWLAGFPVSVYLGFATPLRAAGLWWGFVAGLGAVALLLLARVRDRLRTGGVRTQIEREPVHREPRRGGAREADARPAR